MNGMGGGKKGFGNPLATGAQPGTGRSRITRKPMLPCGNCLLSDEFPLEIKPSCRRRQEAIIGGGGKPASFGGELEARHRSGLLFMSTGRRVGTIHRQDGPAIIADSIRTFLPRKKIFRRTKTLFEALCQMGYTGYALEKAANFIQARSVTFFWDKLKGDFRIVLWPAGARQKKRSMK